MEKAKVILLALLIAGCKTTEPDATTSKDSTAIEAYGTKTDTIESRAAAAVVVAKEANKDGKPTIVEKELSVAEAYLPKPTPEDVRFARKRASEASDKDYEANVEAAARAQRETETLWANVEAEKQLAIQQMKLKDEEIAKLRKDLEQAQLDGINRLYGMLGVGLFALGVVTTAFLGIRIGGWIMLGGATAGAIPFVLGSQYFAVVIAGTLGVLSVLSLVWIGRKMFKKDEPVEAGQCEKNDVSSTKDSPQ